MKSLTNRILLACLLMVLPACTPSPDEAGSDLKIKVHEGSFARIQQFETESGVSVWLVEEPSIPILSVRLSWEAGSANDPEGLEGLSSAMAYHMNEGAGAYESEAFFKQMESLNMSFGCSASKGRTSCSTSMLTEFAEESFELIGLALSSPRFDEGPFERYKREKEVSLKTRETNASYLARRALREALYPDHPYAREISAQSLSALTAEAMAAQKDRLMTRDRLLVTAVGAISPEVLAPLLDQALAALPETSDVVDVPQLEYRQSLSAAVTVDLAQPQSLVTFTSPGLKRDDPDYYPAVVLNYVFGGGGFDSRLMQDLRVEKGLTYGVSSRLSAGRIRQSWGGSGQTKNESAGAFIAAIKANMDDLAVNGVTEKELQDAKAYLTGSYPLGFDSNSKIASRMMAVRKEGLGVEFFDTRNALVEAVSLEDVNRVAAEWLDSERFSFFVVGQPQGLEVE